MAELARLSRTLCRLEGARGATFIEPIQDTLARCDEFVSAYLTGATATPQARARGDWLVGEVRRLMDEVEWLLAAGAKAEADAVAALAEWRARGLEHAVKAGPLSDQMALPEPEKQEEQSQPQTRRGRRNETHQGVDERRGLARMPPSRGRAGGIHHGLEVAAFTGLA